MLYFVVPFRKMYDKVDGEQRYHSPKTLETWTLKLAVCRIHWPRQQGELS